MTKRRPRTDISYEADNFAKGEVSDTATFLHLFADFASCWTTSTLLPPKWS